MANTVSAMPRRWEGWELSVEYTTALLCSDWLYPSVLGLYINLCRERLIITFTFDKNFYIIKYVCRLCKRGDAVLIFLFFFLVIITAPTTSAPVTTAAPGPMPDISKFL